MRKIKFRGQTSKGEWFYGDFVHFLPKQGRIIDHDRRYVVKMDTVGQFTGVLDSNKKEIYEGDIIEYDINFPDNTKETKRSVVSWEEKLLDDWHIGKVNGFCNVYNDITVIGNIHDNPELIPQKSK